MPSRYGLESARSSKPPSPQLQHDQAGYNGFSTPPQGYNQYYQGGQSRAPAGKYDGPSDTPSRGPGGPSGPGGGFGPSLGYDPARMSRGEERPRVITNTRMELPAEAYRLEGQIVSTLFCFFVGFPFGNNGVIAVLFTPPLPEASSSCRFLSISVTSTSVNCNVRSFTASHVYEVSRLLLPLVPSPFGTKTPRKVGDFTPRQIPILL